MSKPTRRTLLRCLHLLLSIPILGYIYEPPSVVQPYADGVRYLFVPILILSGYWMYAGWIFALIGVGLWLGAYRLAGFGPALLSQVVLFVGRFVWLRVRTPRRDLASRS